MPTPEVSTTDPNAIEHSDLSAEISKNFARTKKFYEDWDKVAKEDYKFALGDQWSAEDKDKLSREGRPCLTFNRIRPVINVVSGHQRENSSRIKVNPEGGEDRIFSESMDRAIKAMDKVSHFNFKSGYWFDDGCYCGKGFMQAIIDHESDPIRGEIKFKLCKPYQIMVDPDFADYDLNEGCGFCFNVTRLGKSDLKDLYPDKAKLISGFQFDNDDPVTNGSGLMDDRDSTPEDDNYDKSTPLSHQKVSIDDNDSDGKFTVKEYWRFKRVTRYFVINADSGEPQKFETIEDAQAFIDKQGGIGNAIKRRVREMWVAAKVCGHILQDEKSPFEPYYSGFPFFRFLADWAPNAEEEVLRVQGITRALKDAQREKNKAKSQYLHMINTQANSGWIGDENALTQADWQKLEELGSKPGIVIRKKPSTELREIQPKMPNQAHLIREEKADQEFKEISNINPDLMGLSSESQSGRAMSIRIKQAVLALARLFFNYRYSKEIVGRFMLQMVPMVYDVKKLSKVLGPDYMAKAIDKAKYPQGLTDGHLAAFLQMVKDSKYDVFVAEADANSTIRFEIFQELSELLKAGAPIPMELLIDYMDLPNSQEVKEQIAQAQAQQAALAAQGAQAKGK